MATKPAEAETDERSGDAGDDPLMDSVNAAIKKMVAKGKERGYVTYRRDFRRHAARTR